MRTRVFLTVDTEIMWRHHAMGLPVEEVVQRSFFPADVGVGFHLETFRRHGLKACFFVDPMPAMVFGLDPIKRVVDAILAARQEVQLHLHPNWTGASVGDGGAGFARFDMADYSREEQLALIAGARALLEAAGAPRPTAFRAGNYAGNDATLSALASLGFSYDSSYNPAENPAMSLGPRQIAPTVHQGLIEVPVTVIEERPGALRTFQICALSAAEMRAALDHAEAHEHAAVTIVSHGFELANRSGTRPNAVHVARFEALCALLGERRETMPTVHFEDEPKLPLGRKDEPLGPSALRTLSRQAQQLWSNIVSERAA